MPLRILIALGAGAISAIAFASAAVGHPLAAGLFFILTPLPLFLAGLAQGWTGAAIAGAGAALLLTIIGTTQTGIFFVATTAAPVAFLSYLALLHRAAPEDADTRDAVEWYPPGRLVIWVAIISGLLSLLLVVLLGGTQEALRDQIKPAVEAMIKTLPPEVSVPPEAVPGIVDVSVALFPGAAATLPMITLLFNLWLAAKITHASGQLSRPWPDIAAMQFPRGTPLALLVTTLAGGTAGLLGLAGAAFSGTLFFAYALMGLAVIHYLTRGAPWRSFALWVTYAGLILSNGLALLVVALLGLVDTIWPLRRSPPPPSRPPVA